MSAPAVWADTVYTSSADFLAAVSGLSPTTEDYGTGFANNQDIANGFSERNYLSAFNLTQGATQGIITDQYNSFSGLSLGADHRDLGDAFTYFLGSEGATLSFAQPIKAFGMFFNVNLGSGQYGFGYPGGQAFTDSASYDTSTFVFVGVVADNPFSSITFSSTDPNSGVFNVPELIYAGTVPEPSSLVLLGTALLGACGTIVRKVRL